MSDKPEYTLPVFLYNAKYLFEYSERIVIIQGGVPIIKIIEKNQDHWKTLKRLVMIIFSTIEHKNVNNNPI